MEPIAQWLLVMGVWGVFGSIVSILVWLVQQAGPGATALNYPRTAVHPDPGISPADLSKLVREGTVFEKNVSYGNKTFDPAWSPEGWGGEDADTGIVTPEGDDFIGQRRHPVRQG